MTLLSRKADYALLILSYLYQRPEGGNARAVAAEFGLSRAFVANILKELCHAGFVVSHRGVKGGYVLTRPAASISLAELLETIEDGFRLTMCNPANHQGHETCALTSVCTLKGMIAEVHDRLIDVLRNVSLADLFGSKLPTQPAGLSALPLIDPPSGRCSPVDAIVL